MRWHDLLFLHWRVSPDRMRQLIPRELELDCFDGSAWIGLVPFTMMNTRFRGVPKLGSLSHFQECNVRTYATHAGASGVWFFSLDAERLLPVLGARTLWRLPYMWSRFAVERRGDTIEYRLIRRRLPSHPPAHTRVTWEVGPALPPAQPGSLEHFLSERYWLFTRRFGRIERGRVQHQHWPLRAATITQLDDSLIRAAGVEPDGAPHAMCSDGVDVEGWNLVRSA
jgi:uncharacterized protein